jgi:4-amino-4-deoxy-L-arabinose transferase-like glycosyltransferase
MATSTVVKDNKPADLAARQWPGWQSLLTLLVGLVFIAISLWLRLRDLGLPFDRDSYDEGVYWQTLRSLSAGHPLYGATFYAQPPMFVLSIFPTYVLFGQTLWAARFGVVLLSLTGLLGAYLLGRALAGRVGALAGLLLLAVNPLYLSESQILQADASSTALSLLAVGLAYLWWENPDGLAGICTAVLCAIILALAIFSKLLVVSALVPIGLLFLAHLWRIFRQPNQPGQTRFTRSRSLIAGLVALVLTTFLIFLPFLGSFHELWRDMVTIHNVANAQDKSTQQDSLALILPQKNNLALILPQLLSLAGIVALYGTIAALLRRDWRVLPLLGWLAATLFVLWRQAPLFPHHLVVLVPPLAALAIMGIAPLPFKRHPLLTFTNVVTALALLLILTTSANDFQSSRVHLYQVRMTGVALDPINQRIARDLQAVTTPDQTVVTDAQFITALANRNTPPDLVDTSGVRISTGSVTTEQLIQAAGQSQVHAVLFYTGRLKTLPAFHAWVAQHFRLVHQYGDGKELWIKI